MKKDAKASDIKKTYYQVRVYFSWKALADRANSCSSQRNGIQIRTRRKEQMSDSWRFRLPTMYVPPPTPNLLSVYPYTPLLNLSRFALTHVLRLSSQPRSFRTTPSGKPTILMVPPLPKKVSIPTHSVEEEQAGSVVSKDLVDLAEEQETLGICLNPYLAVNSAVAQGQAATHSVGEEDNEPETFAETTLKRQSLYHSWKQRLVLRAKSR